MNHKDEIFTRPENIGYFESIARGSLSIALLVAALLITEIGSYSLFALTQIAIYLGLTAFIGWDPIYSALKQHASHAPVQPSATGFASELEQAEYSSDKHKKAA